MDQKERERLRTKELIDLKRKLNRVSALDIIKSKKVYWLCVYFSGAILIALLYICISPRAFGELFLDVGEAMFNFYSGLF